MAAYTQALHVQEGFNAEEAAHVAAEFVSSLDNLPGEVTFLLEEIKEKDARINQLLNRINNRHIGLTKHVRTTITAAKDKEKEAGPSTGASSPPFPLPLPPGSPLPTGHLTAKDAQALTKITSEFGKVQALQEEKIALAERMERIIGRAKERGRAEWTKVGGMDLQEVQKMREAENRGREEMGSGMLMLPSMGLGAAGERPKKRKPHGLSLGPSFPPPGHTIHPPPVNTSMMPPPAPTRGPGRRRADRHQSSTSRFSEPDHPQPSDADADGEEYDPDAEGEDAEGDVEVGDGDDQLYCTCRQNSYGEMIGCDAQDCPIEWYHVTCVGVQGALPETWYCPLCVERLGLADSNGRREKKGRKAR